MHRQKVVVLCPGHFWVGLQYPLSPLGMHMLEESLGAVSHLLERIERRILWGAINPKRGVN